MPSTEPRAVHMLTVSLISSQSPCSIHSLGLSNPTPQWGLVFVNCYGKICHWSEERKDIAILEDRDKATPCGHFLLGVELPWPLAPSALLHYLCWLGRGWGNSCRSLSPPWPHSTESRDFPNQFLALPFSWWQSPMQCDQRAHKRYAQYTNIHVFTNANMYTCRRLHIHNTHIHKYVYTNTHVCTNMHPETHRHPLTHTPKNAHVHICIFPCIKHAHAYTDIYIYTYTHASMHNTHIQSRMHKHT